MQRSANSSTRTEWQVGDLVMWDNTATIHRGRWYDLSQRRELRRATTEKLSRRLSERAGICRQDVYRFPASLAIVLLRHPEALNRIIGKTWNLFKTSTSDHVATQKPAFRQLNS